MLKIRKIFTCCLFSTEPEKKSNFLSGYFASQKNFFSQFKNSLLLDDNLKK